MTGTPGGLRACLEDLDRAIDAAGRLGLDTSAAREVRSLAAQRLGFPGSVYLLALAGGTGVGKSSLLNALAGSQVSRAGVRRPTTGEPVAWVPVGRREELAPVLEWLGVREVHEHTVPGPLPMAILDLPDLDSIAQEHRDRVDALLPKIDAVAWVADPEKYGDAILHNGYLALWGPRLARQAVLLNKTDLLGPGDAEQLRSDFARRLRAEGLPDVPVLLTAAVRAPRGVGNGGTAELERWLESGAEAKRVIAQRLAASARAAVQELALRAGVRPGAAPPPLVGTRRREQLVAGVTGEILRLVDLPGLERQAVAASRLAARPRGAGPIGRLMARISQGSGHAEATADPARYLSHWRDRGALTRAAEPLRGLVTEMLPSVPPAARGALVAVAEPGAIVSRLTHSVDRAVEAQSGRQLAPRSALWWLIGALQFAATAGIVFALIWLVALWLVPSMSASATPLPILGAVPQPVLLLALSLLASFLLGRLLHFHAGWLGRRWARRLRSAVTAEVSVSLRDTLLVPIDALDAARGDLALAAAAAEAGCDEPM